MNKILNFISLFIFLSLGSCKNNVSPNYYNKSVKQGIQIGIDLTGNNVCKASNIYDSLTYIKLETTPDCVIGVIDKIIPVNDRFIVVDKTVSKSIFLFDTKGKFITKIGTTGRGAKEFDSPDDVTYNKYREEIVVWCNNLKKILTYKIDGTFLSEFKLDYYIYALSVYDKKTLVVFLNNVVENTLPEGDKYNLLFLDLDGNTISKQAPVDIKKDKFSGPCNHSFSSYNDSQLFFFPYKNTINTIYIDSIAPRYYVNYGAQNLPEELLAGKTFRQVYKEIKKMDVGVLTRFLETDSYIYLGSNYGKLPINSIYNKRTKKVSTFTLAVNDIKTLYPLPVIIAVSDDSFIGYCESHQFVPLRDLYKNISKESQNINNVIKGNYQNLPNGELKSNFLRVLEDINFKMDKEEIDFVSNINESDNPIIIIGRLNKSI